MREVEGSGPYNHRSLGLAQLPCPPPGTTEISTINKSYKTAGISWICDEYDHGSQYTSTDTRQRVPKKQLTYQYYVESFKTELLILKFYITLICTLE